jgi:hypothetical protein
MGERVNLNNKMHSYSCGEISRGGFGVWVPQRVLFVSKKSQLSNHASFICSADID